MIMTLWVTLLLIEAPPDRRPTDPGGVTERVSVSTSGDEADGMSMMPDISADGRFVTFESGAGNLVPDDDNCASDVFVFDRLTRTTERVSISSTGLAGDAGSQRPRISGDGRFIAFQSNASNLVPHDLNGCTDIFVHDRLTGRTTRASEDLLGAEGDNASIQPRLSSCGRYVAFHSAASWDERDVNGQWDVYLKDLLTGDLELISLSNDGAVGNDWSEHCYVSSGGRWVVYHSKATNLVPDDRNDKDDIFIFDRAERRTRRLSVNAAGEESDGNSAFPAICGDGRWVVFESDGTNLVPDDTNRQRDVFLCDTLAGALRLISRADQRPSDGASIRAHISDDGRFVVYVSQAMNLDPRFAPSAGAKIYFYDVAAKTTALAGLTTVGTPAEGACTFPMISADGAAIAFVGFASDLVPDDRNNLADVFVRAAAPYDGESAVAILPDSPPPKNALPDPPGVGRTPGP
ncbi:MAG: hypothetical protein BroJett003_05210 [Planctomycetota bacterium]|nr:MAG: hypothetical protein BroJett003_05210 [Planctomycetota bacterium]